MDKNKFKNEKLLYALALVLALGFRFFKLGAIPLSEFEADWALQAFQLAQGQPVQIGPQPAYVILTSMLFSVFSSSVLLARLLPALFGSAIIYLPFVLRDKLGKNVALIFAFGLAFDPGLVTLSRLAGGPMLALSFTILAIAFWHERKSYLAGTMAGLALLSGPSFWVGSIVLMLSLFVYTAILKREIRFDKLELRQAFTAAGIVFLLLVTNLFRLPSGISAFGSSFSVFLAGFTHSSQIAFGRLLIALFSYQTLAILFLIAGLVFLLKYRSELVKFNLVFLGVTITFLLLYPSRQVGDLVWALIPIWLLASISLVKILKEKPNSNRRLMISIALIMLSLFALFWLSLINLTTLQQPAMLGDFISSISQGQFGALSQLDLATKAYIARIAILVIIPIMSVLLTVLVGLWWNPEDSWQGFLWGLLIFLLIFMAGSGWNGIYQRRLQVNELWLPGSTAGYPELMLDTLGDLSEYGQGTREAVDIISLVDSDALAWSLRFMPNLRFKNELAYNEFPSIVITSDLSSDPSLNSSYRGQSFVLSRNKSWQRNWLPSNFLNWLAFRNTPEIPEIVILWARTDLFPDHVNVISELQNEDNLFPVELP